MVEVEYVVEFRAPEDETKVRSWKNHREMFEYIDYNLHLWEWYRVTTITRVVIESGSGDPLYRACKKCDGHHLKDLVYAGICNA